MRLTPPQIGRLCARSRGWAYIHVLAGDFGPATRDGRAWTVDLADVEKFVGTPFTPEQIAAATNTRPINEAAINQDAIHEQS